MLSTWESAFARSSWSCFNLLLTETVMSHEFPTGFCLSFRCGFCKPYLVSMCNTYIYIRIYTVKFMKLDKGPVLKSCLAKCFQPIGFQANLPCPTPNQGSVRRIRLSKDPNNKDRSPSGTSNLHGSWRSFGGRFLFGNFQNVETQTDFWLKLIRKDVENVYTYMYRLYFSSWSKTVFLLQGF